MWQGVVDAAQKRDVNVICFVGLCLHSPNGFEAQANVIYDLVSAEKLDGLVIMAGTIGQFVWPEEKRAFIERYHPLPIVTLEGHLAGIPNIYVDSFQNMRKAVLHLIQVHNYRRIAFIRGPENHQGANERYRAYVETLAEYGLPLDPALVTLPLKWLEGRQGLSWLLDHHVDFEAVIGANDDLALGALEELRARGIQVPEKVVIVGYDDAAQSRWITPPLTTVPIETYKWGQQALEMVLSLIEGKPVPEQVVIPTELVIRQSCGCPSPAAVQAAVGSVTKTGGTFDVALAMQREHILAEMVAQVAGTPETASEWAGQLLDSFAEQVKDKARNVFLRELDKVLRQVMTSGSDVAVWQGALSALRRCLLPYLSREVLSQAEDLWQQARVVIGEAAERAQARQALQAEQQAQTLRDIGAALLTTFDVGELVDLLAESLPRLGIPSCYLALYENPRPYRYPQPAPEWSRLVLACTEKGRAEPEPGGRRFPSRQLVPEGTWPEERRWSFVVEPLYFQEDQIGFVLFEVGPRDGSVYDSLRREISSALQSVLLSEERKRGEQERKRGEQERKRGEQERKRGEEVLSRERNLLRALIDNIPDRIYAKDIEGRFIICNVALARRMSMTSPDELVGKSDFDLVPRELAERFYADEQAIIRSGQPLLNREEPLEIVDGKITRWNLATKVPMRDSQGNIIGIVGLGREITDLKQTQVKLERNALQLRTATEVSRAASSILDLDELLPQVVELIRDRFDLYYVGLFLKDEAGQYAVLRAGMGAGSAHEAGQQMLAAGHKLEVGGASMIGWCIANRQARIALDAGKDAVRLANRLLPETRSEMALPLISRGQAIGALTIQSSQAAAFTEEDISILQTMAGQVANAIENARLNERTQAALKEMEATQRRYVQKAWAEYLPSAKTTHYEIGRPGSAPLGDAVLPEMQRAAEQQSTVALSGTGDTEGTTHSALVTPITLRGNVIGVLGIHDDQGTRQWTAEEIALVEAVADRMAQTAETLRLFDETQRRAARERLINEITARIRSSATLDGVLNVAVREIGQVAGASFAAIDLELPEAN
jgi:PAS domain S-box-containing protein